MDCLKIQGVWKWRGLNHRGHCISQELGYWSLIETTLCSYSNKYGNKTDTDNRGQGTVPGVLSWGYCPGGTVRQLCPAQMMRYKYSRHSLKGHFLTRAPSVERTQILCSKQHECMQCYLFTKGHLSNKETEWFGRWSIPTSLELLYNGYWPVFLRNH